MDLESGVSLGIERAQKRDITIGDSFDTYSGAAGTSVGADLRASSDDSIVSLIVLHGLGRWTERYIGLEDDTVACMSRYYAGLARVAGKIGCRYLPRDCVDL